MPRGAISAWRVRHDHVYVETSSAGLACIHELLRADVAPEAYANLEYDPFLADVYSAGVILFLLLTGSHAYETPSLRDARFASIWAGKQGLEQLLSAYKIHPGLSISLESVDLLSHILCPQQTRFNLEQIIGHSWCKQNGAAQTRATAGAADSPQENNDVDTAVPMDMSSDSEPAKTVAGQQSATAPALVDRQQRHSQHREC